MEGSFIDINRHIHEREVIFNRIVANYGNHGDNAANTYVLTRNGYKRLRDITIIDGEDLFDRKVELLISFIPIDILRTNNIENVTRFNGNTGRVVFAPHTTQSSNNRRRPLEPIGGGMKNKKVKKCEKKKVVLGKERCIYKVSGSKKDYMKYKGKLVPVSDYVKSMKKKN